MSSTQKDRLYGRYIYNDDFLFSPAGNLANWGIDQTFHRQGVVVSETHLFSPTLVNNFQFSFNRVFSYIVQTPDFLWSDLGANIPDASPVTHSWQSLTISGYFNAVTGTFWDLARNTYNDQRFAELESRPPLGEVSVPRSLAITSIR